MITMESSTNLNPKTILPIHKIFPAIVPKPEINPASKPCITNLRNVIICAIEVGKHKKILFNTPIINFSIR